MQEDASYLTAHVSAAAVRHNLRRLRGAAGPGVRLCAVVKADAYGHGVAELLPTFESDADALAVATPDEAVRLRQHGATLPILTFFTPCALAEGPGMRKTLAELIARDVTMTLVEPGEVAAVEAAAAGLGRLANVHVKIDTGMTRSGALPERAPAVIDAVRAAGHVRLGGLYTHFATADEADKSFTLQQLQRFLDVAEPLRSAEVLLHAANTAATLDLPETRLDMVRPGIACYGYFPSAEVANRPDLRPCLRLTGRLMQLKDVPAGSRCGYGLSRTCERASRLGLVPVGYGDGYFRCLGNRATMRIRGADAPIMGRVSMDQTIIDLTDVPAASVGDEVEILSPRREDPHSVERLAALAGTIPYELTCRLGARVRRVLVA